ncbi:helix-turn-helix transcriptional regulator [Aerococcus tenax]|uniref:helix-turn-helix transcriptional regulator n=1 Tax=Aerococcus tenax TaxID=3078812 RepID=UPI0018A7ABB6|nr:hypothetical protein [Aerococcus tenax]
MTQVRQMRSYMGLTQTDLANTLNISLQAYWKKEKGITPFTDDEKIVLKKIFNESFPSATIDDIFFSHEVSKV